jgi:hypothetical protein
MSKFEGSEDEGAHMQNPKLRPTSVRALSVPVARNTSVCSAIGSQIDVCDMCFSPDEVNSD